MILKLLHIIKTALEDFQDLRMIDFDRGQLDSPDLHESILQPALLISVPSIAWEEITQGNQSGDLRFITKTIVRMPHNYAFYSEEPGTYDIYSEENQNALLIEDAIHQLLIKLSGVVRLSTSYIWVDTFFVVEHTYEYTTFYNNIPRYHPHSFNSNLTPGINVIINPS